MNAQERNRLIALITQCWERSTSKDVSVNESRAAKEHMFLALKEYGDRLPRVAVGRCPHTGGILKRSFDPFGLDGHWWHSIEIFTIIEPVPPPTFKVWLGALRLHGRIPVEAQRGVEPGPEVPFVIPRLLSLPDMRAVIASRRLDTGDRAYIITYWSTDDIAEIDLHQGWLRSTQWMKSGWTIHNDEWDFDLRPYLERGSLRWIAPDDDAAILHEGVSGCPYLDLPGDRLNQILSFGERSAWPPPDDEPVDPFADPFVDN